MILNQNETYRKSKVINSSETASICNFIESEIRAYLKTGKDQFTVSDLFGGDNYYWCDLGLPIGLVYERFVEKHPNDSDLCVKLAGIAVGNLTKIVARRMKDYTFELERKYMQIVYHVVKSGKKMEIES